MMRMDTLLDRNDDACTPMHVDTSTYGPLICLWIVVMFIDFFHRSQNSVGKKTFFLHMCLLRACVLTQECDIFATGFS